MRGAFLLLSSLYVGVAFGFRYEEYKRFLEEQSKNETFVRLFEEHVKRFKEADSKSNVPKMDFPCQPFRDQRTPTTVHELSPFDIKVVAALGDSITAGTGINAKTIIGVLIENRGQSWSGGGDGTAQEHITLPNILKIYNPEVVGYATGTGSFEQSNAHLNIANPGDKASNMPFQARELINRMKSGKEGVDWENDWKIITMFIGGNDLCDFCEDKAHHTTEKYVGYIQEALDILHAEVPRALVNIVEVLNVSVLPALNEGIICEAVHFFVCKCAAYPSEQEKQELAELVVGYQRSVRDLVDSGRYDTRDDFTVVDQPFFSQTTVPKHADGSADLSYYSPDCFHLSSKGQEVAAYALWDNMVEPVGRKRRSWNPGDPVNCPDEQYPFFYTRKNSPSQSVLFLDEKPDNSNTDSDSSSNSLSLGIVIGVCALVIVAGSVYLFKRKSARPEKLPIAGEFTTSYTQL